MIVLRGRVFAGLTTEGRQVLATALSMLKAEEALRQDLSAGAGQLKGQLRMAAVPTAMRSCSRVLRRCYAQLCIAQSGLNPRAWR